MTGFEYKVVPAPLRGLKARGVKSAPERFALTLQGLMNDLGAQGWEYQRTDTLPVEERQGLTGKATTFQNMLVFRRALAEQAADVTALIEDQSDRADHDGSDVEAAHPPDKTGLPTDTNAGSTKTPTPDGRLPVHAPLKEPTSLSSSDPDRSPPRMTADKPRSITD